MPAIASLEDLKTAQEGFGDEFFVDTTYDSRLTTYGQWKMAQNRLEEFVWSPHGKGSSHSKAGWGRQVRGVKLK